VKQRTHNADSQAEPRLPARFLAANHKSWLAKAGLFVFVAGCLWFFGPLLAFAGWQPLVSVDARVIAILVLAGVFVLPWLIRRLAARRRIGAILLPVLSILLALLAAGYLVRGFYASNVWFAQLEWLLGQDLKQNASATTFDDQNLGDTLIDLMPQLDALAGLQRATDAFEEDSPEVVFRQVDQVAAAVQRAYRRGIENLLQPLLVRRLEQQLDGEYPDEYRYEALKVYLMLHNRDHRDADTMASWISLSLEQDLSKSDRSALERHVRALVDLAGAVALDASRVERVRRRLRQAPLSVRAYSGVRAAVSRELVPWRLSEQVPAPDLSHFVRVSGLPLSDGIPGLYTAAGYQAFRAAKRDLLERQLRENWVLDDVSSVTAIDGREALDRDLEATYAREFIRHWQAFLDDLQVAPVGDLDDLTATVGAFSSASSPLKQVLQVVTRQTRLLETASADSGDLTKRLSIKSMGLLASIGGERHAEKIVRQHFRDLNSLFDTGADVPPTIDAAVDTLSDLKRFLDAMSLASDLDGKLFDQLLKHPSGKTLMRRVSTAAARQPVPLKYWLQSVSRFDFLQASALADSRAMDEINKAWRSGVLPQCEKTMNGQYPFDTSSVKDIPLAEFAELFASGGVFDRFWQQHLEPYVDTTSSPWRIQRQTSLPLGNRSLAFFERVATIRSTMFSEAQSTPRLSLQIKPLLLSADIAEVRLSSGDWSLRYLHGPARTQSFNWPSAGELQARIDFSKTAKPDAAFSVVTGGPWALFRLFDRAKVKAATGDRGLRLTFAHDGDEASFLLGMAGAGEFVPSLFDGLRCPETL